MVTLESFVLLPTLSSTEIALIPPWCLSQDVLIDCNHILSQHSIISSLSIRSVGLTKPGFPQFLHKEYADPVLPCPSHGCSLLLFISLHMHMCVASQNTTCQCLLLKVVCTFLFMLLKGWVTLILLNWRFLLTQASALWFNQQVLS